MCTRRTTRRSVRENLRRRSLHRRDDVHTLHELYSLERFPNTDPGVEE